MRTGGLWTASEAKHHINYLELLAILLALKVFVKTVIGRHVKIMTENTTTMADVNHMGKSKCPVRNVLAKEIWLLCFSLKIWVTAVLWFPCVLIVYSNYMLTHEF